MPEAGDPDFLTISRPAEIPGLVAFWHFTGAAESFTTAQGKPFTLRSRSGRLEAVCDPSAPLGGRALELREGQWLSLPRRECPALNFCGARRDMALVAWVRRKQTAHCGCEFVARMWNETQKGRQPLSQY